VGLLCLPLTVACGGKDLPDLYGDTGGAPTATGSGTSSSTGDSDSGAATDGGERLDIGVPEDTGIDDGGSMLGCQKVDFLFVIDNSGSMTEEQANLVASFDGFITTIRDTLMAEDFHIMVTDTDAMSVGSGSFSIGGGTVDCMPAPNCCIGICNGIGGISISPPPTSCNAQPCSSYPLPTGCIATIGAARTGDAMGNPCGIDNGSPYMLDTQSDLSGTFSCVATVGTGGDGLELPMEAMIAAIGAESDAGGCNEGFLRDDAVLVVTFITDEDDENQSMGDPTTWRQTLVDAKNGDEEAVVILGLIADEGYPGGVCTDNGDAPVLRSFAESFTYGSWSSVCAPDYSPFFADAVSVIDTACDGFVPPD
jgi:hypothetical protein